MCAATCVSFDLVDTPVPAHKAPLRWTSTPISATQVNIPLSAPAACTLELSCISFCIHKPPVHPCLAAPAWFCDVCTIVGVVYCVFAWLLLLQPLSHLSQCPLHVDAWMVEPATLTKVVCPSASEFGCMCHLHQRSVDSPSVTSSQYLISVMFHCFVVRKWCSPWFSADVRTVMWAAIVRWGSQGALQQEQVL